MPAIRKPTNVLELNGSAKHDPKRMLERGDEPQNEKDIGKPPSYLSKDEKRWPNQRMEFHSKRQQRWWNPDCQESQNRAQ